MFGFAIKKFKGVKTQIIDDCCLRIKEISIKAKKDLKAIKIVLEF